MLQITNYFTVNDTQSELFPFKKTIKKNEINALRKQVEKNAGCWEVKRTITGIKKKKIKRVYFIFKEPM